MTINYYHYHYHHYFITLRFANCSFNFFISASSSLCLYSCFFILTCFSFNLTLFDWLCLCILFISLKMLKSTASGLILIKTQSISLSNGCCLCISWSIFLSLCPNTSTSIENKYQFYNLKHCILFAYFLLQMHLLLRLLLFVL